MVFFKFRGESFRRVLFQVGELRSLVSSDVNVMALNATATKGVREEVQHIIGMKSPYNLALTSSRANIMLVVKHYDSLIEAFTPLINQLSKQRELFPKTIVYCKRLSECGNLYMMFRKCLGIDFTEPEDAPDHPRFRLVDIYHSSTKKVVQEAILSRYSTQSSLRVVVATIAFGMGIDCAYIRQIIHVGPPDDVESYIQETGRAGRDNQRSLAALLLVKGATHVMEATMKEYCKNNNACRRNICSADLKVLRKQPTVVLVVIFVKINVLNYLSRFVLLRIYFQISLLLFL